MGAGGLNPAAQSCRPHPEGAGEERKCRAAGKPSQLSKEEVAGLHQGLSRADTFLHSTRPRTEVPEPPHQRAAPLHPSRPGGQAHLGPRSGLSPSLEGSAPHQPQEAKWSTGATCTLAKPGHFLGKPSTGIRLGRAPEETHEVAQEHAVAAMPPSGLEALGDAAHPLLPILAGPQGSFPRSQGLLHPTLTPTHDTVSNTHKLHGSKTA